MGSEEAAGLEAAGETGSGSEVRGLEAETG